MADEKILKDEILSEEDLDEVAGGTTDEINSDARRLQRIGMLGPAPTKDQVGDALYYLGQRIGLEIGCDLHDGSSNTYYINNKKVSRDKLWNKIREKGVKF